MVFMAILTWIWDSTEGFYWAPTKLPIKDPCPLGLPDSVDRSSDGDLDLSQGEPTKIK